MDLATTLLLTALAVRLWIDVADNLVTWEDRNQVKHRWYWQNVSQLALAIRRDARWTGGANTTMSRGYYWRRDSS